ncbi:hypothetical protein BJ912DRAFT_797694, partial [Pholiota molesta]
WTDLPSAVDNLQRQRLTIKDLVTYDEKGTKFYSFHARLLEIGMIVLALSQIIRSLADFFYGEKRQTFVIDKDFQFLRMLAWNDNPDEMIVTYIVLQRRCANAVKHVHQYLNKLKKVFSKPGNIIDNVSISSYDSTTPSERSRIDKLSPRSTLQTYLMREDY